MKRATTSTWLGAAAILGAIVLGCSAVGAAVPRAAGAAAVIGILLGAVWAATLLPPDVRDVENGWDPPGCYDGSDAERVARRNLAGAGEGDDDDFYTRVRDLGALTPDQIAREEGRDDRCP